ncbi:hypothetical protein SPRG_22382 [Saprolegnia parasitica CBS 223.65]|uniref:Uncharacterized protein n=1 Tax=Saprolegnia parasitica (strain CBS 223.65) TaxID=695850 RepID=A0A067BT26_SAPPC|nr:hypothetical protein SPRG_22382 [Saprolegnia parasitica CBS 223.65]KDO17441.1 hypothetical protein SPRG_22382 [Saprolegnia parasitica CBS 223.65]|eukprot:XP_012211849.1 hypothetical protein SPRG_22382 [Saprolegnia parasitica CBS 223.65]
MLRGRLRQLARAAPADAPLDMEAMDTTEDDALDAIAGDVMDDTLAAIHMLLGRYHRAYATFPLPSLVLAHHIYSVVPNRTLVDRRVHELRMDGTLLMLHVNLPGPNVHALLLTHDYTAFLLDQSRGSRGARMFAKILPRLSMHSTLAKSTLYAEMRAQFTRRGRPPPPDAALNKDIAHLVHLGFLVATVEMAVDRYYFSLPRLGALISALHVGRRTVRMLLQRAPYREMTEHDVLKRKVKSSPFGMSYHVLEMAHAGLVARVPTATSFLLKYTDPADGQA